jgi:uncharacterized protein
MPSLDALLALLACVVLASIVQHLTAFAFGLVLLGLVAVFDIVPIADATNASMVLALANSVAFLVADDAPWPWAQTRHVLWTSMVGVAVGLGLQIWLSANAAQWLRLLLGVAVVLSALNLILVRPVRTVPSSQPVFAFFGALSGLLGGLFATSGPPIVYHMMRQPFDPLYIRRCLMLVFAANNTFRLLLVSGTGHFSRQSLVLCAIALPVALLVTLSCKNLRLEVSRRSLLWVTGALLCVTGTSIFVSAARAAFHPAT